MARGRDRDRQLDLAAEARERLLERLLRGWLVLLERLPFRIPGRGRRGQVDVGDVALVQADEAWRKSSCPTGQLYQKASGERIQRPRVARARAGAAAQLRDEREGRSSRRLVDEDDADRSKRPWGHPRP